MELDQRERKRLGLLIQKESCARSVEFSPLDLDCLSNESWLYDWVKTSSDAFEKFEVACVTWRLKL